MGSLVGPHAGRESLSQGKELKVLSFSYETKGAARTGRELLAEANSEALKTICGARLTVYSVSARTASKGLWWTLGTVAGWLDGLTRAEAVECVRLIQDKKIDVLYIEGSNYGRLARYVRSMCPSCRIVTFFHNVEARFFWGALRHAPSMKAGGVLLANWIAETCAVQHSDRIICLNERDSALLQRLYGRGASDIHPITVRPPTTPSAQPREPSIRGHGLFVGGAFYANVDGVRWFARNVAPHISCQIFVVGKGFERYRDELAAFQNIVVVGTVDSVDHWYERSSFVVAPIFDGSGMKTKIAEAIMYGRPVIGTSEAFVGYEDVRDRVGRVCDSPEEFALAIRDLLAGRQHFGATELREIYEHHYSMDAKARKFEQTFANLNN